MALNPICEDCNRRPSAHAHHDTNIVPWKGRIAEPPRIALCVPCHALRTRRQIRLRKAP